MKRGLQININLSNKVFYSLIAIISILSIVAIVVAVNPSTKPNPGHASNEVMVNIGGVDKTLQQAIDDSSLGGRVKTATGIIGKLSGGTSGSYNQNFTISVSFTPSTAICASRQIGSSGDWGQFYCSVVSVNSNNVVFNVYCVPGSASCGLGSFTYLILG